MKFVAFWVLICSTVCGVTSGQDVLQRLAQYEAESHLLNAESCVLFDATQITANEKEGTIIQVNSIGRRVVWRSGAVRVDVRVTNEDLISGSVSRVFRHFIEFGQGDYLYAVRQNGVALAVFEPEKDRKDGVIPPPPNGFNSPFLVAVGGSIDNRSSGLTKLVSIDGSENTARPVSDRKAKFVRTFSFSEDTAWAVSSWKSIINPKAFELKYLVVNNRPPSEENVPNWAELKNPKQYVKDWKVAASGTVEWKKVDDVGVVPERVVTQYAGIPDRDPSKSDLVVNYFGYEFDIKPMEKLFDRKRFNDANLTEDFPIDSIVEQAEAVKKAHENKAAKKSGRRK